MTRKSRRIHTSIEWNVLSHHRFDKSSARFALPPANLRHKGKGTENKKKTKTKKKTLWSASLKAARNWDFEGLCLGFAILSSDDAEEGESHVQAPLK